MDIVSLLILRALSGGGGGSTASDVSYDNSTSGLDADNVQNALDELSSEKLNTSEKGSAGGVAELNENGLVLTSQLPSFVDDVLEFPTLSDFPAQGESGKIYVDLSTNITYRWGGSSYTEISPSLALGETSSTAYRGDRGKAAYDHSQLKTGNPHNVTKAQIGLGNVDNTSDANKPISTATQAALDTKLSEDDLYNMIEDSTVSGNPVILKTLAKTSAKSAKVTMLPIQSGSGDPSPTNIRPIIGRDTITLKLTGKNIADISANNESYKGNGTYFSLSYNNNTVTFTPTISGSLYVIYGLFKITSNLVGKKIILSYGSLSGGNLALVKTQNSDYSGASSINTNPYTILESDIGYYIGVRFINTTGEVQTVSNIQVEYGETATTYKPYSAETHTSTFPSTVYGGEYEFVSGKLTDSYDITDLGDYDWAVVSGGAFRTYITDIKYGTANLTASIYKQSSEATVNMPDFSIKCVSGTNQIIAKDSRYTDATAFKDAMSGVQLAYELATPIESTLTPQSIELNKGINVLTTDGNNTEIVYTELDLTELPDVTSADEGKVLTVNSSGEWVAQTLPDGTNISY